MKKFVYYGLVLIVVAIVLALISGYLLNGKVSKSITSVNVTVNSGSFTDVAIGGGNYSAIAVYMIMENNTNMYLMNGSTFAKWSNELEANKSSSGLSIARALGINSSYVFVDKRDVYTQLLTQPSSGLNSSLSGTYVVIDNTAGSNSTAIGFNGQVTYIPLQLSSLLVYEIPMILALIVGLAGLIVLIYGIVKKGEQALASTVLTTDGKTKEQSDKEYIDQIYKGVDSDKKKRSKKGRKKETEKAN